MLAACATFLVVVGVLLRDHRPHRAGLSSRLPATAQRLVELHTPLPAPRTGDWREGPGRAERGQTYEGWCGSQAQTARGTRTVLYVQVIGDLEPTTRWIVDQAASFLGLYFGLRVKRLPPVAVDEHWPTEATRRFAGRMQLRSRYILAHVLHPRLPEDAAALLGLTTLDLWPGDGWNFVFGEASLHDRVGVWSIARFGNPSRSEANRVLCLARTLKVATHETGHMFGMEHCLAYACNMCGSNSLAETDRHPLRLCPECLPKVWDATGVDPAERFARLMQFAREAGLHEEAAFYEASHDRLTAEFPPPDGAGASRP